MDIPREDRAQRRRSRWGRGLVALAVIALLWAPIKRGAVDALELGARAGWALVEGAPTVAAPPENAAWLETPTPQQAAAASSHSGGLLSPAYNDDRSGSGCRTTESGSSSGSAAGLAYGEGTTESRVDHPGTFTQVYLEPEAFSHYLATGAFREGTTFALEMRRPTSGVSIARDGWFAGDKLGVHLSIKDTERFGGWRYFNAHGSQVDEARPSCNACHSLHGAIDNVFVQFYPVLDEAR